MRTFLRAYSFRHKDSNGLTGVLKHLDSFFCCIQLNMAAVSSLFLSDSFFGILSFYFHIFCRHITYPVCPSAGGNESGSMYISDGDELKNFARDNAIQRIHICLHIKCYSAFLPITARFCRKIYVKHVVAIIIDKLRHGHVHRIAAVNLFLYA